ncbi:ABC transporter ATP-binding protein [Natranaerofaba carboxydovora]|uniref:ABC transporter ATP-binding protein n=1 Tax=Natranaerofaba carboxydovora TaxID=2742683 RepID=UPI001F13343B|nr:ABC transporter ATP-binding protein [Natranaerofaba carboxydovora]UMZ74465.1 Spermidine/putrescine import ATP-binding protein PotA [Natranaerofaba carboxydovora]
MYDIELKNVTKTYIGTEEPAVKNLNLNVNEGSIVTLLGPSGCGKSTTLRLIAGFEQPEEGSIALAGKTVCDHSTHIPPENRGVGMVFQDYALFPHLNVFKNIGFGYKGKDYNSRVKQVIESVGLNGYEDRYPNELSGGQQQRVALARALVRKPVVILLDEPFSNLDADMRVQMRLQVKRIIKEAGATAVFVSHDQKDALAISDKIVVMNEGVIQQYGTPKEIYQYPENKFVANFVGQSNILEGKMNKDEKSVITNIGVIPCNHTHGFKSGEEVYISIRPDSLEMDKKGSMTGCIKETIFTGESIDAVVEVKLDDGSKQELLTHIHPEEEVNIGDTVKLTVLPHFVAVIRHD